MRLCKDGLGQGGCALGRWFYCSVYTARQNVTDGRDKKSKLEMGEHDIYLTLQHLAFYKSNRYLIKAQGNWLLERWMFNCLLVYLEIFI